MQILINIEIDDLLHVHTKEYSQLWKLFKCQYLQQHG